MNSLMTGMSMYTDNTHAGDTIASSSRAPSTHGGRRAKKKQAGGKVGAAESCRFLGGGCRFTEGQGFAFHAI